MRVVCENARSYNTLVMRWIWGGILLTVVVFSNQSLVWASGGNGVERAPIFSWGSHARTLDDNETRELVEKKIKEECPAVTEQDPEKPIVVSSMVEYSVEPTAQGDRFPTKRFLVELRRDSQGARKHDLAVIVETRRELSKRHEVMVITVGENGSDCKRK